MKNGKPWDDMEANGRLNPLDQSTGEKGFKEKSYLHFPNFEWTNIWRQNVPL